jgi:hypothetical protein
MKKIATRKLLAGAIGLLALFPGAAFAQSTLSVEAIETDNGAPPHNVVCDAETADVFSCLIWSPTGVIVERGVQQQMACR